MMIAKFERTRILNKEFYSEGEISDMRILHEIYKNKLQLAYGQEIGDTPLAVSDDFSCSLYKGYDIVYNDYHNSLFNVYIGSAFGNIKTYLARKFNSYKDNPKILLLKLVQGVLNEIAILGKTDLSSLDKATQLTTALEMFMVEITYNENLFPEESQNSHCLKALLWNLAAPCENIKRIIKKEKATISAKDTMQSIILAGRNVLNDVCRFLFYIVNPEPNIPLNFSIPDVLTNTTRDLKHALDSRAGHILLMLINSPEVLQIFSEIELPNGKRTSTINVSGLLLKGSVNEENINYFVTADYNNEAGFQVSLNNKNYLLGISNEKESVSNSLGIIQSLKNSNFINNFLIAHALAQDFAALLSIIDEAKEILAKKGGDISVYIAKKREMEEILQNLRNLQDTLLSRLDTIRNVVMSEYDQHLTQYNKIPLWHVNITIASTTIYQKIEDALNVISENVSHMLHVMYSINPSKEIEKWQEQINNFDVKFQALQFRPLIYSRPSYYQSNTIRSDIANSITIQSNETIESTEIKQLLLSSSTLGRVNSNIDNSLIITGSNEYSFRPPNHMLTLIVDTLKREVHEYIVLINTHIANEQYKKELIRAIESNRVSELNTENGGVVHKNIMKHASVLQSILNDREIPSRRIQEYWDQLDEKGKYQIKDQIIVAMKSLENGQCINNRNK